MQTFQSAQATTSIKSASVHDLTRQCAYKNLTTHNEHKYAFDIDVYKKRDKGRLDVEQFIKHGFLKTYGANITISMPWVLAINNGSFKAALGIRPATEALFIEQYIAHPIEQSLSQFYPGVKRSEIAEVGHLYSNATKFTIPLFLTTAVSLFFNDYKFMVFSATEHVLELITRSGISHTPLSFADSSKLTQSTDCWGTYYDTNPKVVVVSLSTVIQVLDNNKRYVSMFEQLQQRIALTSQKLNWNRQ